MITAVVFAIASEVVPNAFKILTLEFLVRTLFVLRIAMFSFIGAISAVIVVIADPASVDTTAVVALELIVGARRWSGAVVDGRVFISAINTVRITITQPLLGYTLRPSPGLVLFAGVLGFRIALTFVALMAVVFVTVVKAIVVTVTDVDPGNAVSIVTGEKVPEAGPAFRAAVLGWFIGTVTTIVITVAVPSSRDAPMVRTAEAVGRTSSLRAVEWILVRVVTAVIVSITQPVRFDADVCLLALQVVSGTCCVRRTALLRLVAGHIILAVVDAVTDL